MEENSQEKEHQPSAKRLSDLRKKGVLNRSRDLTSGLLSIFAILAIFFTAERIIYDFKQNFILLFSQIPDAISNQQIFFHLLSQTFKDNLSVILVILFSTLVGLFLSPFLFGGWNFTWEAIHFNFDKINLVTNLSNIFNLKRALEEVFRSFLKAVILIGISILFFYWKTNEICVISTFSFDDGVHHTIELIIQFIFFMGVAIVLIVAFDILYQFFQFQEKHKMSTQELKDEYKEMEGSVEVKRKIKSRQMAILKQRLTQVIPKADVIITNPTHYSVALKYQEKKDHAPRMIAKGKGVLAQQIRQLAVKNAIPIYEAPPLARAIYHTTQLNAYIKPELYISVAIVLSYINQLRSYQFGTGQLPKFISEFDLPPEFIYKDE